jgi:Uma2 family endonuclease
MSKRTDARAAALDLAEMLPAPGSWSAEDYLWLSGRTKQLVELADGWLEVVPMPTERHQRILLALYRVLHAYLDPLGGIVLVAPLRLRLADRRFREPDLLLLRDASDRRRGERFWTGADLVVEVLSPDDPDRDLVVKRAEYAAAGIGEYWIVDPEQDTVTVLGRGGRGSVVVPEPEPAATDESDGYVELGRYERGDRVTSRALPDAVAHVDEIFND